MDIKEYIKKLNIGADKINKKARNPFLEYNFAYNPFMGAIEQTYIWIERSKRR